MTGVDAKLAAGQFKLCFIKTINFDCMTDKFKSKLIVFPIYIYFEIFIELNCGALEDKPDYHVDEQKHIREEAINNCLLL